jgi:hypothetical protein
MPKVCRTKTPITLKHISDIHTILTPRPLQTDPTRSLRPIRHRRCSRLRTNLTDSKSKAGMMQQSSMCCQARETERGAATNKNLQGTEVREATRGAGRTSQAGSVSGSLLNLSQWTFHLEREGTFKANSETEKKGNQGTGHVNSEYQWTRQLRYS